MECFKRKRSSSTDSLKEINPSAFSKLTKRPMLNLKQASGASAWTINDDNRALCPKPSAQNDDHQQVKELCEQNPGSAMENDKSKQLNPAPSKNRVPESFPICGRVENDGDSIAKKQRMDAFRVALERIQELQQSLEDDSSVDSDNEYDLQDHLEGVVGPDVAALIPTVDPHTLGFIACAQETMKYLMDQGIPRDDPMVINLRNRLIEGIDKI